MSIRSYEQRSDVGARTTARDTMGAPTIAVSARVTLASEQLEKRTTDVFSALADPTRLRILQALAVRDLCVSDIATVAGVSPSAASHQLRLLRDRDLVSFRRDGKRAVYRLADDHVRLLLEQGFAHAAERE